MQLLLIPCEVWERIVPPAALAQQRIRAESRATVLVERLRLVGASNTAQSTLPANDANKRTPWRHAPVLSFQQQAMDSAASVHVAADTSTQWFGLGQGSRVSTPCSTSTDDSSSASPRAVSPASSTSTSMAVDRWTAGMRTARSARAWSDPRVSSDYARLQLDAGMEVAAAIARAAFFVRPEDPSMPRNRERLPGGQQRRGSVTVSDSVRRLSTPVTIPAVALSHLPLSPRRRGSRHASF